jgi:hypothetical protein
LVKKRRWGIERVYKKARERERGKRGRCALSGSEREKEKRGRSPSAGQSRKKGEEAAWHQRYSLLSHTTHNPTTMRA